MTFTEKLGSNQRDFAEAALLRTICENPAQTVGEIWDSLESDGDAEFMFEIFKKMSVGRLVTAAAAFASGEQGAQEEEQEEEPAASGPDKKKKKKRSKKKSRAKPSTEVEVDDDEFEDDDEEWEEEELDDDDDDEEDGEDDESDDDDDEDPEPKPKGKKKGKKGKKGKKDKKSKSSKKKKSKSSKKDKDEGHLPGLSSPDGKKKYQSAIVKYLKSVKAYDEPSGKRSTECRDDIGGSAKQFRENINEMFSAERVLAEGKARGMKYFLPKKKK